MWMKIFKNAENLKSLLEKWDFFYFFPLDLEASWQKIELFQMK